MSSGRTHVKASVILSAGFLVGSLVQMDPTIVKCAAGSMIGVLITPDLDVDRTMVANKIIKTKLGQAPEWVWRKFWRAYATSCKHGQFMSHFPVFGTTVRLAYIYFLCILVPHALIYLALRPDWSLAYVLEWYAVRALDPMVVYGLMASDLIHYALDKLTKNVKE